MIIVVEGPDNGGKTTLAQYLAKQLRAVFVKVERPRRAVDLTAYQNILEVARSYSGIVVTDRHVAISEPIYGKIVRGGHDLKEADILLCLDRLDAVIYCRPPIERIIATISERAQMEGVVENTTAIVQAYDDWYNENLSRFRFIGHYDYTEDDSRVVLHNLNQQLARLQGR